jgi:uncharacterized protein YdbL (DUF1318 family)
MKMRVPAACVGGLAIFLSLGNQSSAATINQRESRQQARIWKGFRSGDLTRQEFRQLERQQALIHRNEARARRDSDFTTRERLRIQNQQNRASRNIFRQSHDGQYWR